VLPTCQLCGPCVAWRSRSGHGDAYEARVQNGEGGTGACAERRGRDGRETCKRRQIHTQTHAQEF